ncbi:MAG: hypothetical protein QOJ71_1628 [Actinomycetota bacterium]|nr:hypothetical protein [Actinomycetota bacterium]
MTSGGAKWVVTGAEDVGPQRPAPGTPDRAPGSMRRTSSIDVVRLEGATGPVRVDARARDLATDANGAARVVAHRTISASLAPTLELATIESEPTEPALQPLLGHTVGAGFRTAAADALPGARRAADLVYLLLDDLPVATLVSGYALQRAGLVPGVPRERYAPTIDLCSGWRAGGTLMQVIESSGAPPMTLGPAAPRLERTDDPDAWHTLFDPAPRTVRRRRRIDVSPDDRDLHVDAMFRDSHFDDEGDESVVHEYALHATIDRATLEITSAVATPHVLPYVECPSAAASTARVVGLRLDELRDRVRSEFVGTSTCTHLNDLLRSLEDVRGMPVDTRGD